MGTSQASHPLLNTLNLTRTTVLQIADGWVINGKCIIEV